MGCETNLVQRRLMLVLGISGIVCGIFQIHGIVRFVFAHLAMSESSEI